MRYLFIFQIILISIAVYGQEDTTLDVDDLYMDFSIPDVAAYSLLNVEPSEIAKPGTVKEFAIGVGGYVDLKGNFKPGLAMEWAPLRTLIKSHEKWKGNIQWKNLLLSTATAGDSITGKIGLAFRYALIDHTNPLNTQNGRDTIDQIVNHFRKIWTIDSIKQVINVKSINAKFNAIAQKIAKRDLNKANMLDSVIKTSDSKTRTKIRGKFGSGDTLPSIKEVAKFLRSNFHSLIPEAVISHYNLTKAELDDYFISAAEFYLSSEYEVSELKKSFNKTMIGFKEEFKKKNWNKWTLEFGAGNILISPESNLTNLKANYTTFYFSTGFPLAGKDKSGSKSKKIFYKFRRNHMQGIAQCKYQYYYSPDSTLNNILFLGTRFLIGSYKYRFSVEGGYIQETNKLIGINESGFRFGAGVEFRITEGNWLELAFSGQTYGNDTRVNPFPKISFRHAFQKEKRFDYP